RATVPRVRIPPSPLSCRPVWHKRLLHGPLPFWVLLRSSRLWRFLWRFVAGGISEDGMTRSNSFRVGKVTGYLRGRVWYLCYFEHGRRRRPRRGPDRDATRPRADPAHG